MSRYSITDITFTRLPVITLDEIVAHMSEPRVAQHMPLLNFQWNHEVAARFVADKEARWQRDGLGHWAILCKGRYAGWGGFQKEGQDWDYGLVLKPECFGLGTLITRKAIAFAHADARIAYVTFLLPPSRKKLAALTKLGASFLDEVDYAGARFLKYRLETR